MMKLKTVATLAILVGCILAVGMAGTAAAGPDDLQGIHDGLEGEGTEDDPYVITDVDELQSMQIDLEAYYELDNDINASETETWNGGAGFDPIGDSDNAFNGSLDGNGYEIEQLYIDRPESDYVALFGYISDDGEDISNVGLVDVTVISGDSAGSLIARNGGTDGSDVDNSYATGNVSGDYAVGGLIGNNNGELSNSYATVDVEGEDRVGGLVGWESEGDMINSNASGNVEGSENVGGLVGWSFVHITDSHATGDVEGSDSIGGLVGSDSGGITDSYATGDVYGDTEFAGGLAGTSNGEGIDESHATGDVEGEDRVGGLVGETVASVSDSHSTGNVTASGDITGGLIGISGGEVTNSYSTGDVDGEYIAAGFMGANLDFIENSHATGDVIGGDRTGGLVGESSGSEINTYATGDVSGVYLVGGLVGINFDSVTESYATGDVIGSDERVGGLVGSNVEEVSSSYATGDVEGEDLVSSLAGRNSGSITESFATGYASSNGDDIGGIVGHNDEGDVDDSYWDSTLSGQNDGIGNNTDGEYDVTGLKTGEMTGDLAMVNMDAFDFESTWTSTTNYPQLQNNEETDPSLVISDIDVEDVVEGGTAEIGVEVFNTDDDRTTEEISVRIIDSGGYIAFEQANEVTLDSSELGVVTFEWESDKLGEYTVRSATENDQDVTTLTVDEASGGIPSSPSDSGVDLPGIVPDFVGDILDSIASALSDLVDLITSPVRALI